MKNDDSVNMPLWHYCQRLVYPRHRWLPSNNPPFPRDTCSPTRRRASWIYHQVAGDPALRAQVLQS